MNEGDYLELCNDLKKQYDAMREEFKRCIAVEREKTRVLMAENKHQMDLIAVERKEQKLLSKINEVLVAENKEQKKLLLETRKLLLKTEQQLHKQKISYELKIQDLVGENFSKLKEEMEASNRPEKYSKFKKEVEAANRRERQRRRENAKDFEALKGDNEQLKHDVTMSEEYQKMQLQRVQNLRSFLITYA